MFASVPVCVYCLASLPPPNHLFIAPRPPLTAPQPDPASAYFLWAFFGLFGAHRFYVGRYESGLFYMFTFGCFFVGWAYDFFILPALVEEKNKKVFHQQMLETGNSLLFDSGEYGYGGGGGGGGGGGYGGSAAAPYYPVSYSGGQHQGMYYPQGGRYDQSPSSSPPRPPRSRPPPRFFNLKHTRPTHAAALPGYY